MKKTAITSDAALGPVAFPASTVDKALLPLGALMLAASVSSWAQAPAAPEATLGTVTVREAAEVQSKDTVQIKKTRIGKSEQDIRDVPQSLNVLTEKMIDDTKSETLLQALHYTGGISFAAAENGTEMDIRTRGFPMATTGDLMIDGVRDPGLHERDTFNYDRIEILRGSASMLFGRGSTGGVINQVNKRPLLLDQYEIEGTAGTGDLYRLTADLNKNLGNNNAFRLNLLKHDANNYGEKSEKIGVAPTFSTGIGTADEITVGAFYQKSEGRPRGSIKYFNNSMVDYNPKTYLGNVNDFQTGETQYLWGSWKHTFADNSVLNVQGRAGSSDRSRWGSALSWPTGGNTSATFNPLTGSLTRQGLTPRAQHYNTSYLQADWNKKFEAAGMKHELLVGADYSNERAAHQVSSATTGGAGTNDNKGTIRYQDFLAGNLNTGYTPARFPVFGQDGGYSGQSFGLFAQDLVEFAPGWKALAGLRMSSIDSDIWGANAAVDKANIKKNAMWSSRLGLLYQPTDVQTYYASYSTSFNMNADTYKWIAGAGAFPTDPEKSRNFELGTKHDWLDGKLSTRLALYRTEKYNERNQDPDVKTYLLSGKRHTTGMELEVSGHITPKLEAYVSYAYVASAKIDKSLIAAQVGAFPGLTPKHSGAVWMTYQATPKVRVGGGIRGVSDNRPAGANSLNKVPGYTVYDMMGEYRINEQLTAQLNVSNLTNKAYGDQLYPGFVSLGDPRTVKVTLNARF